MVVAAKIRPQIVQRWRPMNSLTRAGVETEEDVRGSGIFRGWGFCNSRAMAASKSRPDRESDFAVVRQNVAPKNSNPVARLDFLHGSGQASARNFPTSILPIPPLQEPT